MLTDRGLIHEIPNEIGGVHRLYNLGKGYQLSAINAKIAHSYPFAWEFAIIKNGSLVYDTPLTNDVEVFYTDDEANVFIDRAFSYVESLPCPVTS